jgi:molybdate transport system ATP-binding protein
MSNGGDGLSVRLAQTLPIPLDAELVCKPGELLALVGPSGSGKTTILRAIAGLCRPAGGYVRCGGETWQDSSVGRWIPPQRRRVGFVFQNYALFPHLSAAGNVICALGQLEPRARESRARELLELVNLAGLEQRRPAALSGGQRQRVALARALAREPAVLLLDEPFSAVDQVTRRKLHRELAILRTRLPLPIVLVTHDLDEAAALADRLCPLYHGRTLQDGTPADVMTRPSSTVVANLVDLKNIFEGRVIGHRIEDDTTSLDWGGRRLEIRHAAHYPIGTRVSWVIPASHIVLHRRGRPSRGERENPVTGTVGELAHLGEITSVTMWIDAAPELPLSFSVSRHAARRNGLAAGEALSVSLLADGIHLMPWEQAQG